MPKTNNLGLELTDDDSTRFKDWRESINGQGDGITQDKSNMQLIDEFAGEVKSQLENVTGIASEINTTVHTDNLPITIKQGTEIYFTTHYSPNIFVDNQIYNSANGENQFPALKIKYGGGYVFYYNGSSHFEITGYWDDNFADNFENDYIKWDKETQILTYKGITEGIIDTCCIPSGWNSNADRISIINLTKFGELEQRVNQALGDVEQALTDLHTVFQSILGV